MPQDKGLQPGQSSGIGMSGIHSAIEFTSQTKGKVCRRDRRSSRPINMLRSHIELPSVVSLQRTSAICFTPTQYGYAERSHPDIRVCPQMATRMILEQFGGTHTAQPIDPAQRYLALG